MPGFVKSGRDEKIWGKAKRRAAHSLDKKSLKGDDYRLANWLYHKMKKAHPSGRLPKHYDENRVLDEAIELFPPDPTFASGPGVPVKVKETVRYEWEWICPHCEGHIGERGCLYYDEEKKQFEHRQCGGSIMLPEREINEKKGCKCAPGTSCSCWAFAPFFGTGHGQSLATIPYNNVIGKDGKAPDIPGDGTTRTTAAPGGGGSGKIGPSPPAGAETGVGNPPSGSSAPGAGGGAVGSSKDPSDKDSITEKPEESMRRKVGLAALNEDLDFMSRVLGPAPIVAFADDPDEDPNRNPMIMDDYYPAMDVAASSPQVEDPLAPMDPMETFDAPMMGPTPATGCGTYTDLDLDDYYDDDAVDPGDLLSAVLTLFKVAVG